MTQQGSTYYCTEVFINTERERGSEDKENPGENERLDMDATLTTSSSSSGSTIVTEENHSGKASKERETGYDLGNAEIDERLNQLKEISPELHSTLEGSEKMLRENESIIKELELEIKRLEEGRIAADLAALDAGAGASSSGEQTEAVDAIKKKIKSLNENLVNIFHTYQALENTSGKKK